LVPVSCRAKNKMAYVQTERAKRLGTNLINIPCQIFLVVRLHEQIFLVKENLSRKNCSCKRGFRIQECMKKKILVISEYTKKCINYKDIVLIIIIIIIFILRG
jgi:hypothetical protein